MQIENMTLGQVQALASAVNGDPPPMEVGKAYLIRCVTHYQLGRVVSVSPKWVVMDDASWIADTGRFYDFLTKHEANEVEPFPDPVIVSTGAIVDAVRFHGELPRIQK